MTTALLWLLISVGTSHYGSGAYTTEVIAKFKDLHQCQRVQQVLHTVRVTTPPPVTVCVQAEVVL